MRTKGCFSGISVQFGSNNVTKSMEEPLLPRPSSRKTKSRDDAYSTDVGQKVHLLDKLEYPSLQQYPPSFRFNSPTSSINNNLRPGERVNPAIHSVLYLILQGI